MSAPFEYPVCGSCGSDDVRKDAYATWDHGAQKWVILAVYDAEYCATCDGETHLVWKTEVPVAHAGRRSQ